MITCWYDIQWIAPIRGVEPIYNVIDARDTRYERETTPIYGNFCIYNTLEVASTYFRVYISLSSHIGLFIQVCSLSRFHLSDRSHARTPSRVHGKHKTSYFTHNDSLRHPLIRSVLKRYTRLFHTRSYSSRLNTNSRYIRIIWCWCGNGSDGGDGAMWYQSQKIRHHLCNLNTFNSHTVYTQNKLYYNRRPSLP